MSEVVKEYPEVEAPDDTDMIEALEEENSNLIEQVHIANEQIQKANFIIQNLQEKIGASEAKHSLLLAEVRLAQNKNEEGE